jgi:hypothetical protein
VSYLHIFSSTALARIDVSSRIEGMDTIVMLPGASARREGLIIAETKDHETKPELSRIIHAANSSHPK